MVERKHDSIHVLRELFRIGVTAEVSSLDSLSNRRGEEVDPFPLQLHQAVSHQTRPVVQLARGGHEDAASRQRFGPIPCHPVLEKGLHPGRASSRLECGAYHRLGEMRRRVIQDLKLKGLLGAEMREQPALGELEIVGQDADSEPSEPDLTGESGGVGQDILFGGFTFAHGC